MIAVLICITHFRCISRCRSPLRQTFIRLVIAPICAFALLFSALSGVGSRGILTAINLTKPNTVNASARKSSPFGSNWAAYSFSSACSHGCARSALQQRGVQYTAQVSPAVFLEAWIIRNSCNLPLWDAIMRMIAFCLHQQRDLSHLHAGRGATRTE